MKLKYFVGVVSGLLIAFGFSLLYNKIPEAKADTANIAARPARKVYTVLGDRNNQVTITEWRNEQGNDCTMASRLNGGGITSLAISCNR